MSWIYDNSITPQNFHSFIYRISFPTGEYYLGKKQIWTMKAKKIHKESNWKDYWSSSKDVAALVAQHGEVNCTREILNFCVSPGEASWLELTALVNGSNPAIMDPLCINANVLMCFHKKVLTGYQDSSRRDKYLKDIKKQRKAAGLLDE